MNRHQHPTLRHALCVGLALALGGFLPLAKAAEPTFASGPVLDLRYRHESVDDGAFSRDATADTLRIHLGYRWAFASGWQALIEGEHVEGLFAEHFNSTANGKTQFPVVADPEGSEINQAWIGYAEPTWRARLGRQAIMLDNQRFFGNVGWRQNEQTFDAFSTSHAFANGGPVIGYSYLDRVLRVFGRENPNPLLREWSLNGHLLHVDQALPLGTLNAYAYLVENKTIATLSTRTLGVRWTGKHETDAATFAWAAEWANQSDYANNPLSQNALYHLFEPSLQLKGITIKAGWEVLGGNGRFGFNTPYATLHAFNGWADRFLNTPLNGLDDRYVGVGGKIGMAAWSTSYHDFRADHGNDAYGHEFDASIGYAFNSHTSGLLKFADYRSDGFGSDVRKLWASIEYKY